MQLTSQYHRPVFYGVPGWEVTVFYLSALLAVAILAWGIWLKVSLWLEGGPDPAPIRGPLDEGGGWQFALRALAWFFSADCLLARRVFRRSFYRGASLLLVMWGFLLLFAGSITLALSHDAGLHFLRGDAYYAFKLILNWAGVAFLIGLLLMLTRRYLLTARRERVNAGEDAVMLGLFLALGVTGFLVEGMRIASQGPGSPELSWFTLAALLGNWFLALGPAAAAWHTALWFLHVYLALFTFAYLPFSKLFHLYAAPLITGATARRRYIHTGEEVVTR